MAYTVRVTGLRETRKAFEKGSDRLKELDKELADIAAPVAQDIQTKLARFGAPTVQGVKVKRRGFEVKVQQTRRKTTGHHPEFGALQMKDAFIPTLMDHETRVVNDVEKWLDNVFRKSDL